ncbi:MAG: pyridoxal phosphate-dependent aminotransferase [Candidatus Sumerlaeia bacterium]|nr:pyridoxal phosphate-dependent aminotransferase [Candidatus Sumerlaeia bacterium]
MKLTARVRALKPSATLALAARAKQMKSDGLDVVGLSAGEPDFDTPAFIKQVALDDIRDGVTKYTPSKGTPAVLAAICGYMEREYGLTYSPKEAMLGSGGKHVLYNAIMALVESGDEVIIPAPYWLSYPEQVLAADGAPVVVNCPPESGFVLSPEQLEAAITPRTKLFILNSPSNPTGVVYTRAQLLALGEVLRRHPHVFLISDDLYQLLTYDGAEFFSLVREMPDLRDRSLIVNGLSKAWSMTGWRLGWAAGPAELIAAMDALQSQSTSNPVSFCQNAAARALGPERPHLAEWLVRFDERRRYVIGRLAGIPDVALQHPPRGAFYVFPDISAHFGKSHKGIAITDSSSFCEAFLQSEHVAAVPGSAFGEDRCFRMSYATSMEQLAKAMDRLERFVAALA